MGMYEELGAINQWADREVREARKLSWREYEAACRGEMFLHWLSWKSIRRGLGIFDVGAAT